MDSTHFKQHCLPLIVNRFFFYKFKFSRKSKNCKRRVIVIPDFCLMGETFFKNYKTFFTNIPYYVIYGLYTLVVAQND